MVTRTSRNTIITFMSTLIMVTQLSAQQMSSEDDILIRARRILQSTPLIDGHNDLPWTIRNDPNAPMDVDAYDLRRTTPGDTDLERLYQGQVGGQFWSVFIPGEIKTGYAKMQLEQIDIALQIINRYPETFSLALNVSDIENAFSRGKIASMLGMEGGYALENSIGLLRTYHALGVRYMTLAHNVTLDWVDSAQDEMRHNGLTEFGKEVVREMNRLGMLVDLSHVTPKVMSDAIEVSQAPVMFSHSSARAVTDHARNVPDSILTRLPDNGGVVMVTFIPAFVSQKVADWEKPLREKLTAITSSENYDKIRQEYAAKNPMPKATLADVADHIEHVRKVAGIDHVGIGSDFWGSGDMPVGLEDVSRFPYLFAELIRRGWKEADLKKLAGRNIIRVMREAERVARLLQETRPASTATIEMLDGQKQRIEGHSHD